MPNVTNGGSGLLGITIAHCPNITRLIKEYLSSLSAPGNNTVSVGEGGSESQPPSSQSDLTPDELSQRNAVIYIVVVLFFYSFGIGVMMIKYMRKEAREQEEFKMYRRYVGGEGPRRDPTDRACLSNRLALQALNMVNVIPQTNQSGSKVTFV